MDSYTVYNMIDDAIFQLKEAVEQGNEESIFSAKRNYIEVRQEVRPVLGAEEMKRYESEFSDVIMNLNDSSGGIENRLK